MAPGVPSVFRFGRTRGRIAGRGGARAWWRRLRMVPVLLCLWLWVFTDARAQPPTATDGAGDRVKADERDGLSVGSVRVDLEIDARARRAGGRRLHRNRAVVRGRAQYTLSEPPRADGVVTLLDFASHLAREPTTLDEVRMEGYAEGPWQAGRMSVTRARVGRRYVSTRRTSEGYIEVDIPAGVSQFELEYEVEVPRRLWPFGCARERCSLSGAVAPLPSRAVNGGRRNRATDRVIEPVAWEVHAAFSKDTPRGATTDDTEANHRLAAPIVSDSALFQERTMPYPSVFWGGRWRTFRRFHRGVEIVVHSSVHRPLDRVPNETRGQLYPDAVGRMFTLVQEAIDTAVAAGVVPSPSTRLVVMHGPLRASIASGHPATVLVSDRVFQVFPSDRVQKFHEGAVVRATLDTLTAGFLADRYAPSVAAWASGMLGFALTQQWEVRRDRKDEYAEEILGKVTFMPAVDRFLYTSQAQFSSSYFRGSEDLMPLRNDPRWFANQLPTGRRIHEKAADLMTDQALAEFYLSLVEEGDTSPVILLERAYGRRLEWFFDQWLGPLVASDYAVVDVRSEATTDGYLHEIDVIKDTDVPVIEPLWIEVRSEDGEVVREVWNGDPAGATVIPTDRGERSLVTFRVYTTGAFTSALLDPRQRIVQTSRIETRPGGRGDNFDPRFNDRVPKRTRFVYTGVGISVATSELRTANTAAARWNAVSAFLAFEASKRRDMRRTANFAIFTDRETVAGVSGTGSFFFLRPRNPQRRRLALRTGGSVAYLNARGLDQSGGLRITQTLSLVDSTLRFGWWPERGHVLDASIGSGQVLNPENAADDLRVSLSVSAGWVQFWRLAHQHVLATSLRVGVVSPLRGDLQFRSLNRVGGIGGLSGFTANEIFGRGVARLSLEYRHILLRNLSVNGLHVAWFRSLGGVLSGGVASVSSCDSLGGWIGRDSWYGSVGYGIQAQLQLLGTLPQLIRLDASIPLGRRRTECLGAVLPDRLATVQGLPASAAVSLLPPVVFNLTFNHPF